MDLIEQRAALIDGAKAIRDKAKEESREPTAVELKQMEDSLAQAEELTKRIDVEAKAEADKATAQARQGSIYGNLDKQIENLEKVAPARSLVPTVTKVYENVQDDPARGFNHIGEFAHTVLGVTGGTMGADSRLAILAAASGNQQAVGSDGGFLVPPKFSNEIWDGLNDEPDNLIQGTQQWTVEQGDSITIPANAETSRATGSRFGGVQGYWINEAAQITTSKPTFRQVKLEPQELAVLMYATNKLLRNSPVALNQYLTRAGTAEIGFLSSNAIVNGTGAGQPLGILNSGGRVTIDKEVGQLATTIVAENIDNMWSRLHPRARRNAVWLGNVDIEPQLQKLTQDVGTGGTALFRPMGSIAGVPFDQLKGRPIRFIEYAQTLGTEGDLILVDLGFYTTAMRGAIESAVSMHLRFDFAEMAFRLMWEIDGQPWMAAPLTPFNGQNTLSAYVTTETRS